MKKSKETAGSGGSSASSEEAAQGQLSRRDLLRGAGVAALSLGAVACSDGDEPDPGDDSGTGDGFPRYEYEGEPGPADLFQHGVASGDPLTDAVILWTRVTTGSSEPVSVWWEIATDLDFMSRVNVGTFETDGDRDFTVKVDADGLEAGRTYYYRFFALGRESSVGRTRTAPSGPVERLRFAVVSCSSYAHGYFHVYRALSTRLDLDAVLHLGDYIYEYATGGYGNVREYEPAHEIVTLDDYRTRHAYYKKEPALQAVHQQHAFVCVWDDHETANNAWKDGAQNHDPETEGEWADRKAAGLKAYFEWMPIRDVGDGKIWRKYSYGDLADLICLDTRLWGRNRQDLGIIGPVPEPDPGRTLLGDDQATWLEETLQESTAQWKLIGQQVMLGNLIITPGMTLANLDQWQGYPESRDRFIDFLKEKGTENVVILTGDIHCSWANEVVSDPNDADEYDPETSEGAVAVEFVTPAVTSPGLGDFLDLIEMSRPFNLPARMRACGRP